MHFNRQLPTYSKSEPKLSTKVPFYVLLLIHSSARHKHESQIIFT